MSTNDPSNLSDAEWEALHCHLPPLSKRGRPPTHSLRTIFDAIFYVLRTGCPWRYLPCNFPPGKRCSPMFAAYAIPGTWFRLLTALRGAERERVGRNVQPSAAIMDAQSVKTSEEPASISGFEAYKHVKGRKRHILVIRLACCWQSTSLLPICTIGEVRVVCSPDLPRSSHASKRSGQMRPIEARS